jgi:hypothetical protein
MNKQGTGVECLRRKGMYASLATASLDSPMAPELLKAAAALARMLSNHTVMRDEENTIDSVRDLEKCGYAF